MTTEYGMQACVFKTPTEVEVADLRAKMSAALAEKGVTRVYFDTERMSAIRRGANGCSYDERPHDHHYAWGEAAE